MQEMMDIQLAKQHREEMVREVELNHKANALRGRVTGTALVSDILHPTGTGADRIAALDAGAVGGVHDVSGRGGHQCTM